MKSRYHSEVHLAKWILQEVRKAAKEGQTVRVQDLVGGKLQQATVRDANPSRKEETHVIS